VHGREVYEYAAPFPRRAGTRSAPALLRRSPGPLSPPPVTLSAPGHYLIHVDRDGYYELKDQTLEVEGSREITLSSHGPERNPDDRT
jgi:hypothetical protein